MTRRCIAVAALVFSLVFLAGTSIAQIATTSLRGVIKDPSGAVVPNAKVTLANAANGQTLTATSNGEGAYAFPQLTPAHYVITVSATGFGDQKKTAELLVNQPATVDFSLTLQSTAQVVNVSAEAQTLNTTDASLGSSMNNALIQGLPSETRNVPDLLSLQPGVLYLPSDQGGVGASETNPMGDSRSGAVNGVRSDQGNVTIDGVDDNDQVFGYAFTGVLRETQDSVEEFRVATSNTNSDEGRSAGAQVSLITKSGTNKFHGSAYEYNRPTLTVANDWFNKKAELDSGQSNTPPKLIRNIFGGTLGGPIIRNKLFFFGNYEGQRRAEDTEVTRTAPTKAYQQGYLTYVGDDSNGNPVTVQLRPSDVTLLDADCVTSGGCSNSQYPNGPGPNPNALAYFNSMPAANGTTVGDGYNTGSYTFASPNPYTQNTSIARFDFTPNDKHRIFVRGSLQKDTLIGVEQFPGQGPSSYFEDNTKGIIAGDTWSISPNLVNDIRYGYVRQGNSTRGVGSGDYVDFRFMSNSTAETRTTLATVPVNNIVDNLNWNKGKHDFQFGVNWRLVHQNRTSDANSYSGATSNPYWLSGNPPDPNAILGQPVVDGGFGNSWGIAYANLVGTVPEVDAQYNYKLTSSTSGNLLADGDYVTRNFSANEFEYYLQDAWKPKPNLTITFGIRHTLLQTPWESGGQEVTPTVDTDTWYKTRETEALHGQVYEPDLTFAPAGPFYGKKGFWPMSKNNIAPRLAIAWAPTSKTTVRAGAGMYYEHFGQGLVSLFDQSGAYGLSGLVTNPAGTYGYEDSPRYTGRSTLPFSNGTFASPVTYPFTPPTGPDLGFAITWGLDSQMKTPYTEAFNLSVQHQFAGGFTLEADYVGTMGRHLIQSLDLAEPVDYVDPAGGGDYFGAGAALSKLVDQNGGDGSASVPAIKYFEDVFPWMADFDYPGESATQAIYTNEWSYYRSQYGATSALADLDFYGPASSGFGFYPAPPDWQPHFWQGQFSSLYALSSIGMSYYNAAQLILRHPMSHGLQLDVSYTFSHSIDEGSDAERSTEFSTSLANSPGILNTWKPWLNRASSDFDTRQLLTVDGLYQLPFGRGKAFLGNANHVVDAFLGGWQLSGLSRTTSGLPFSLFEPGWTTDWQQSSFGVVTGPVKMHKHFDQNGDPQYFDNVSAINSGVNTGGPIRLPYPGEAGERNYFRGDGYFDIDGGLSKTWGLGEYGSLKFDWETFNVTNTVRFDPELIGSSLTSGNLGIASTLLTQPRRMEFALRYDF
ncbi:MAG TPA: TonB-dependent receptor [Acidobacteriaceae bacterium]|nr:TonB-dependent receptor [Acidobacteriaceae bacterium]